jgi:U3 small nucleolar RNA-associated protein 12
MVKAYLRYEFAASYGVVASANANVAFDADGRHLFAPALESVARWSTRTAARTHSYAPPPSELAAAPTAPTPGSAVPGGGASAAAPEVTRLARAPRGTLLAAGYSDGSVRLWDSSTGECPAALRGHRSAVTALAFSRDGALLASGSKDTDVVLWDVAAEAGLFRLRGHTDQVTDVVLLGGGGGGGGAAGAGAVGAAATGGYGVSAAALVSCSKDGHVRVWDLSTQTCRQVLLPGAASAAASAAGGRAEVWSLDAGPCGSRVVVGGAGGELALYRVDLSALDRAAERRARRAGLLAAGEEEEDDEEDASSSEGEGEGEGGKKNKRRRIPSSSLSTDVLLPMGTVRRLAPAGGAPTDRAALVRYSPAGLLAVLTGGGRSLEVYRVVGDAAEAARRARRRRKRRLEKKAAKKRQQKQGFESSDDEDEDDDDEEEEEDAARRNGASNKRRRNGGEDEDEDEDDDDEDPPVSAADEIVALGVVTSKHKARSFAFCPLVPATPGGVVGVGGVGGGAGATAAQRRAAMLGGGPASSSAPSAVLARVALGLANNAIDVVDVTLAAAAAQQQPGATTTATLDWTLALRLEREGHRSDIRAAALSPDDATLLTVGGGGEAKLWGAATGECVGTVPGAGYGLCAAFAPGGRHAVVGTREGSIEVYDAGACERVHTVEKAHGSSAVWSLALLPDRSGVVSGGADKTVRFWTWAVGEEEEKDSDDEESSSEEEDDSGSGEDEKKEKKKRSGSKGKKDGPSSSSSSTLRLVPSRTLELSDDVLCVRLSPDGRLLAASLLDGTVRVFFADSLKFFLSLYGHKLPVLSMDISSDNALIATGGADKNVRVWGLDFGDCHRSLFAHGDAVTSVSFVRDTHYLFSAGRDRAVRYWDLDRAELLLDLPGGFHGECWWVGPSAYGDFVLAAGADRSVRRWERTDEPFFVEEERERRLESLFEADLERQQRQQEGEQQQEAAAATTTDLEAAAAAGTAAPAGRRTLETVGAADSIIDALDMAAHEEDKLAEAQAEAAQAEAAGKPRPKAPPANPALLGLDPGAYVRRALGAVRAGELEQALLLMPFADALRLLAYVASWLDEEAALWREQEQRERRAAAEAAAVAAGGKKKKKQQAAAEAAEAAALPPPPNPMAAAAGAGSADVELCARTAALLLRLHHAQLSATPAARPVLRALQARLRPAVQRLKDTLGFNVAALRHLQRQLREGESTSGGAGAFEEAGAGAFALASAEEAAVVAARKQIVRGAVENRKQRNG